MSEKVSERITVVGGAGLLTECDMSLLLGISVNEVISRIQSGRLPGRKLIGRKRSLTSVSKLIKWSEEKQT